MKVEILKLLGDIIMLDKSIIETIKVKSLVVTIQHVFRANFNDTYWLEDVVINLDDLDNDNLTWFDPFNGRSKINNTLVAIKYVSDDKFIILKNIDNVITEEEREIYCDYIVCEDFDKSVLLASHIKFR